MAAVFVTGTGTDVGKTYVSAALLRGLVRDGVDVDALKPLLSGFDPTSPAGSDPALLLEACGRAATLVEIERIAPYRFRAPLSPPAAAREEGRTIDAGALTRLCRERIAASAGRLLLVEGAGGVMSPVDDRTTFVDLIAALGVPAILVAGSYLGAISHTLTAAEVLRSRKIDLLGVVISESAAPAPSLSSTCDAIGALLGTRVFVTPRGAGAIVPALLARVAAVLAGPTI
jgi:dethiobiotin synthetase